MTKVLHIITNLPVGGAQDNTLLTVEKLDKQQYAVTLVCGPGGEWVERAQNIPHLELIIIDELVRPIKLCKDIKAGYKLYKLIKNEKYDIIHTHSSKPGFLGRFAARMAGRGIVIHTIHGFPFNDFMHPLVRSFFILIEKWMSCWTDRLITVSQLNLKKAVDLNLADENKFVNIYSGIDFSKFEGSEPAPELKSVLSIGHDEQVIGMVGRLSEQKAPDIFIKAMPAVLQKFPNCRFVLVGDGELREEIERLSRSLGIDSKIVLTGFQDDVRPYLALFDVFVLSSLWEGLGRSLTEAMYMRCPVTATAVEGVPELVKDNITGKLVPPNNPDALAEGILYHLENPRAAAEMGEAARQLVEDIFNIDKMISDIDELYRDALKKNRNS